MAIGLTTAEIAYITNQSAPDGDLVDYLDVLNETIAALNASKGSLTLQSGTYKKFYDYWTQLTTYSVAEKQYTFGDYNSTEVTESIITSSAQDNETILFPVDHFEDYPKRVAVLYGTDSSGWGDGTTSYHEYGKIVDEENEALPLDKFAHIYKQEDVLENNIIPSLGSIISEMQSEVSRYSFLSTLISEAQTSLALAGIALVNAKAVIAGHPTYPPGRPAYLIQRKSEISSRISQITSTHAQLYDQRYVWLDLRINKSYGAYGEYLIIDSLIAAKQAEKIRVQQQIDAFNNYIG